MSWLVLYLFGSSPAVCKSFFQGETQSGLTDLDGKTAYGRYATSLRMSDIGYSNNAQSSLNIPINSLEEYTAGLTRAISTPHPPYEEIGLYKGKKRLQLSSNILQIANEFYSTVRPKRVAKSGEEPTAALRRRGVEYVEIRSLDLDPFSGVGVNQRQLDFMECLMLHCALTNSSAVGAVEQVEILENDNLVASMGRDPNLTLLREGQSVRLSDWALEICEQLLTIADILDAQDGTNGYRSAIECQLDRVRDSSLTPSARVLHALEQDNISYHSFGLTQARKFADEFRGAASLNAELRQSLDDVAVDSLQKAKEVEAADTFSFEEYLKDYFTRSFL